MGTQAVELALTPTMLLERCAGEPHVFLLDGQGLDSWGNGEAVFGFGAHSTLCVNTVDEAEVWQAGSQTTWHGDPFSHFERFCAMHLPAAGAADGRVVVAALNYDLRRAVERFDRPVRSDPPLPLLVAAAYDWTLAYSYRSGRFELRAPFLSEDALRAIGANLQQRSARPDSTPALPGLRVELASTRAGYESAVRRVLDYIAAGDVYQVNFAHRFSGRGRADPAAVFAALQRLNAVPFAAFVRFGDLSLLCNSPEYLLSLRGNRVATAPIKGTRRRGTDPADDEAQVRDLLADPKERAEHVMVVDLERNDLGRVCRVGSVRVAEFAQPHTFPGLHHLVSTIEGERRADVGLADLLRATFPGGSVTGAPKIRAMQIIDELEPVSRGFYTGSIACVRTLEDAVFNLAIRTATVLGERIWYWAGGGIVADSIPEREYEETILKARPFLMAVANPTL